MSVYNETMSNTPEIEISIPTSCYNCNNDCPGIFLDIFKEDDPLADFMQKQTELCDALSGKGYRACNLEYLNDTPVIEMSHSVVARFVKNMSKLGYTCNVYAAHKPRYKLIEIKGEHPFDLIRIFNVYLERIV